MDLGGWLWRLGLERYEAAFRENEISEKVLPSLTAEDLKELGVAALGYAAALDAIAALRADTSAKTIPIAPAAAAAAPTSATPDSGRDDHEARTDQRDAGYRRIRDRYGRRGHARGRADLGSRSDRPWHYHSTITDSFV
jgi:hypothetical protein